MRYQDTIWCDGCGVEILGSPVIRNQQSFCCQDCALGYECACKPETEKETRELSVQGTA